MYKHTTKDSMCRTNSSCFRMNRQECEMTQVTKCSKTRIIFHGSNQINEQEANVGTPAAQAPYLGNVLITESRKHIKTLNQIRY